jgi:hypothetical protein
MEGLSMWLSDALLKDAGETGVKVFYVSYQATRRWAVERDAGEPLVFSGWYWALGAREAGPFKSRSAAWRDAWYRLAQRKAPPVIARQNELFEREQNIKANKQTRKKRASVASTSEARV